jgi:cell division topological specificity factor
MRLGNIFKKVVTQESDPEPESKAVAKERLQLVLMQDRANVSAEFLEMMKNEIVSVIQKYIDVDEEAMDIRLTTEPNEDGTNGIPKIYANIPIIQIKNESKFGRLQIQNAAGEIVGEVGRKKEPSKFAEVNEGEIFEEGTEVDNIEIEGTVIDRKEPVQEEEEENIVEEVISNQNITDTEVLEDSIDELDEYLEEDDEDEYDDDDDDDVTFDDLLKAAEEADEEEEEIVQDEELDDMKKIVEEIPKNEDEEDSLLQKLSDIDEDSEKEDYDIHAKNNYNSGKKNKKNKRRRYN